MKQRTLTIRPSVRVAALATMALLLSGCSTYYQSHYPDSGVYYGDSGVYGQSAAYSRAGYGPVNPIAYPYWSIDYFYFSQYYHPYSVYVGYNEPLYYPYPGWAFSYRRPIHSRTSLAFGFGYPWYGHRYPAYSFGFFSGYDPFHFGGHYRRGRHDVHRIRQIDRRLESLQRGGSYASRRELLGRDRVVHRVGGTGYEGRVGNRNATRPQSRAALLRRRDADASSRAPRTRSTAPSRRIEQRRAPDVRSERRSDRRALDRDRIRRDGGGSSAYQGHRGSPIESLRGRVIVNSRNDRTGDARHRDASRRDRSTAAGNIRRSPAIDRNRAERPSRQASGRTPNRSDDNTAADTRGNLLNRSPGGFSAPPVRPDRRAAPPPRPARDTSRPDPPSRSSSSSSRRAIMRDRSDDGGRSRRRR